MDFNCYYDPCPDPCFNNDQNHVHNRFFDLGLTASFGPPFCNDLNFDAVFFRYDVGDQVQFVYNGANCQGILTEQIDNPYIMMGKVFKARVEYCDNWPALGNSTEVCVESSALSFLAPGSFDDQ